MRVWLRALAGLPRRKRASNAKRSLKHSTLHMERLDTLLYLSVTPHDPDFAEWSQQTFTVAEAAALANAIDQAQFDQPLEALDAAARALIGANTAQQYGYTGQGYTVAIIDTGVDYRHPALAGDYLGGWDFVDNDSDPMDLNGHGTHVAGIISSSNSTYLGIAPDVDFVALRVLDAGGSGTYGNVLAALQWVQANRERYNIVAVNMSLGSGNFIVNPYTFLEPTLASLKSSGVFVAAASGNSFYSNNSQQGLGYPAISPNVVSVGAVWDADYGSVAWANGGRDFSTAADRITSFTQRSPGLDLLAPGAFITSSYLNNGYAALAGTSMAAPVAVAAAVIVHQALDATGQSHLATPDGILAILKATGRVIVDGDDENDNVVNTGLSFKRVDLSSAIDYVESAGTRQFVQSLYVDVLGRNADSYGLNYYSTQLRNGTSRADIVEAFWNSTENRGRIVDGLYSQFLNRSADSFGRAYWIARMAGGDTIEDLTRAMLNSAEYSTRNASNSDFVDALYRDVMGRNADAAGKNIWMAALTSGTNRAAVANAFLSSSEFVNRVIDSLYNEYLGRRADQYGLNLFRGEFQSGVRTVQSLAKSILASDEYFARHS